MQSGKIPDCGRLYGINSWFLQQKNCSGSKRGKQGVHRFENTYQYQLVTMLGLIWTPIQVNYKQNNMCVLMIAGTSWRNVLPRGLSDNFNELSLLFFRYYNGGVVILIKKKKSLSFGDKC